MSPQFKKITNVFAISLLAACTIKATAADQTTAQVAGGQISAGQPYTKAIAATDAANNSAAANPADSTTTQNSVASNINNDPYEAFNRASFKVNDCLDKVVFKPVAQAYQYILPSPVRTGVNNFYNNLNEVPTIINDLLQFSFLQAMNDSWRLFLNTTIGIGGIFDVATAAGLPAHYSDFGLTLAKWGYTDSAYLELPILGPGTVRDQIAFPINYYGMTVYPHVTPFGDRAALITGGIINLRANALTYNSLIQQISIDPYVMRRNAYMQNREYKIQQTLAEKPFYIPNGEPRWVSQTNTNAEQTQTDSNTNTNTDTTATQPTS